MGKIILEDFSEGDGYYKVDLAYLSKEQVEEIEALVSKWKPTDEDIKACIGMCLTDVNEQRFKDYGTNLRDCLAWLEKQAPKPQGKTALEAIHEKKVDNANKVEVLFNIGDWIVENGVDRTPIQITEFEWDNGVISKVWFSNGAGMYIELLKFYHKWTIQEARDGDVLVSEYNKPFIYNGKHIFDDIGAHCGINIHDQFTISITECNWTDHDVKPATKEQSDLLFKEMREAGWEWDAEKKKLKKINWIKELKKEWRDSNDNKR